MDIGGTLTKIVYFEANRDKSPAPKDVEPAAPVATTSIASTPTGMKRHRSFVNLDAPEHKQALEELYEAMDENKTQMAVRDDLLSFYSPILGGKIHFLHFETRNMMQAINYLSSTAITQNIQTIGCTGGGGHKYARQFAEELEIKVVPLDELGCLVKGMDFALTNVDKECYTYRNTSESSQLNSPEKPGSEKRWQKDIKESTNIIVLPREIFKSTDIFPYLVVNIGSGVSILKVSSPGQFVRVSGSSLGGGTYWGLCRLLTSCMSYEKVLDLAEAGDASEVDMLVKDIYGGSCESHSTHFSILHFMSITDESMNLSGSMVASSFGKLVMKENPREGVKEEDLAIALLMMITNNIGQVAYLNAQLHDCTKIFFVGSFLRHNSISCRRLAFAIDFWSKGKMEALFLRHEGYFGALGTFLQSSFESEVDNILSLGHDNEESSSVDDNREGMRERELNKGDAKHSMKLRSLTSDEHDLASSWKEFQGQPWMKNSKSGTYSPRMTSRPSNSQLSSLTTVEALALNKAQQATKEAEVPQYEVDDLDTFPLLRRNSH